MLEVSASAAAEPLPKDDCKQVVANDNQCRSSLTFPHAQGKKRSCEGVDRTTPTTDGNCEAERVNPFTAPTCTFSGLKGSHSIRASEQYISVMVLWSYDESTFNTVHFDRNPFTCSCSVRGQKSLNDFKFGTLFSRFPIDGAASTAVKGLRASAVWTQPFVAVRRRQPTKTDCGKTFCPA